MASGRRKIFNTDVIVIGGGPGGAAAAIRCALGNLSVTLLESRAFPREHPGETLHPGVEALLRQLTVWEEVEAAGFLRHAGQWVTWAEAPRFVPFGEDAAGPWLGLQAWRADFDRLLLKRAESLGVKVIQPCRVLRPLIDSGRVTGVRCEKGDVRARFVIDASGGNHWLGRRLGLEIKRASPRFIAYYGYCEGEYPIRDAAPSLVADDKRWTWIARVSPGLYQWTRLTFNPQTRTDARPPTELRGLTHRGPARASEVTWRILPEAAGEGYFLVGDAAAVLDPVASHGVLRALMSGIMTGHLAGHIIHAKTSEQYLINSYRNWLVSWFMADVDRLAELYKRLS